MKNTYNFTKIYISLMMYILPYAILAQTKTNKSEDNIKVLPEITINGHLKKTIITSFHEKYVAGTQRMTPATRCVIWLKSPDSTKTFIITNLLLPLERPAKSGRLSINLYEHADNSSILGKQLLNSAIIYDNTAKGKNISINLGSNQIILPKKGVMVSIEGLPTSEDEIFIKEKVSIKKTKKNGSNTVNINIITKAKNDTTLIYTDYARFPELRKSPSGYTSNTWVKWPDAIEYKRESASSFRGRKAQAFDTVVFMELETSE